MEVIYICQYCGGRYKSEKRALACEKKAKEIKNKFQVGQVVYDEEGYRFEVMGLRLWKMTNFIQRLRKGIDCADGTVFDDFPEEHCFAYKLKWMDAKILEQIVEKMEYELKINPAS